MSVSTWCKAVKPSTFAVFMSAPRLRSLATSSVSPLEHAAKNTHPSWNLTFLGLSLGVSAALFVSDSFHRFNCSCLFSRALVCFESSAMTAAPLNTQLSWFLAKVYVQPKMASRRLVQLSNEHWIVLNIKRSTVHHSQRCCVHSRIKEDLEGYLHSFNRFKILHSNKLYQMIWKFRGNSERYLITLKFDKTFYWSEKLANTFFILFSYIFKKTFWFQMKTSRFWTFFETKM